MSGLAMWPNDLFVEIVILNGLHNVGKWLFLETLREFISFLFQVFQALSDGVPQPHGFAERIIEPIRRPMPP